METYNKQSIWSLAYEYSGYVHDTLNGNFNISGSGTTAVAVNQMTGFKNPGWKDQIRAGVNATTVMSGTRYTGDRSFVSWQSKTDQFIAAGHFRQVTSVYSGYPVYPVLPSSQTVPPNVVSDVTNRCIRKFIKKANEALSSNNLTGRSIKHLQHDLHSLVHPMADLQAKINSYIGSLEKASKFYNRRSKAWLNVIRNSYLEFTFGLKPFTDDITAILVDASRRRFSSVPISASAQQQYSNGTTPYTVLQPGTAEFLRVDTNYTVTYNYSVKMMGAIRTGTNSDGRIGILQDLRLTPSDFLPTAFSIIPYAWMINYFTNIGDIVDGLAFPSDSLAWACQTHRQEITVSYTDWKASFYNTGNPNITGQAEGGGGSTTFKYVQVNRDLLTPGNLIPSFEINIPTKKSQWVNMMAAFLPRIQKLIP